MKLGDDEELELDAIDWQILDILQRDCKVSLAQIGQQVRLSPPSVLDRVKKLEEVGIIRGYHAHLDGRQLGLDVTAFVGVTVDHPTFIEDCALAVSSLDAVQEIHHVTGEWTLLLKMKTRNTSSLEQVITQIRCIKGVTRTETMVVLSTQVERSQVPIAHPSATGRRKGGRATGLVKPARRA
ncbi:MAG: Lrp/AsnC family transcriptional regulator [Deltaproteobacteria bacterium]|nr:Lrp/AsnC family transcriptional regulator [Deltaproteobacteria bacterium]